MARAKYQAEKKLDNSRNEGSHDCYEQSMRSLESDRSTLATNIQVLHAECQKHKNERDVLAQAFSILGVSREVHEHSQLFERVSRLEVAIKGTDRTLERGVSRTNSFGRGKTLPAHFDTVSNSTMPLELSTPNSRSSTITSISADRFHGHNMAMIPTDRELVRSNNSSSTSRPSSGYSYSSGKSPMKSPLSPPGSNSVSSGVNRLSLLQKSLSIGSDMVATPEVESPHSKPGLTRGSSVRMMNRRSELYQSDEVEAANSNKLKRTTSIRLNAFGSSNTERIPTKHKEQLAKIAAASSKMRQQSQRMLIRSKSQQSQRQIVDKSASTYD
jgi:hypothetical protein